MSDKSRSILRNGINNAKVKLIKNRLIPKLLAGATNLHFIFCFGEKNREFFKSIFRIQQILQLEASESIGGVSAQLVLNFRYRYFISNYSLTASISHYCSPISTDLCHHCILSYYQEKYSDTLTTQTHHGLH